MPFVASLPIIGNLYGVGKGIAGGDALGAIESGLGLIPPVGGAFSTVKNIVQGNPWEAVRSGLGTISPIGSGAFDLVRGIAQKDPLGATMGAVGVGTGLLGAGIGAPSGAPTGAIDPTAAMSGAAGAASKSMAQMANPNVIPGISGDLSSKMMQALSSPATSGITDKALSTAAGGLASGGGGAETLGSILQGADLAAKTTMGILGALKGPEGQVGRILSGMAPAGLGPAGAGSSGALPTAPDAPGGALQGLDPLQLKRNLGLLEILQAFRG